MVKRSGWLKLVPLTDAYVTIVGAPELTASAASAERSADRDSLS
jgi:hypothetical protein